MVNTSYPRHFEALYPVDSYDKQIAEIFQFVKNGHSCQLIGLPGVGRSNLLGLLPYNRGVRIKHVGENDQTKFHFVLINFSEIRRKPLSEATKLLFVGLVDSLRERKWLKEYKEASKDLNEALASGDELVIFQGLKKMVDFFCLEKELTIVFLFDRFEEYLPMLSQEFFTNLSSLRGRAKFKFSVVFSLNRPIEEIMEPLVLSDFYEFLEGNIIYLPVNDKTSFDFRLKYFQKNNNKPLPQKIVDEIVRLSGGHGKLTRLCLEAFLSVDTYDGELSDFLLSKGRVRNVLYEIWNFLNPSEQQRLEKGDLTDPFLEKLGLIKSGKVAIPLFEKFFLGLDKNIVTEIEKSVISYDSYKDEIKKGDLILSDMLTSAEFKLLRFLLQNPDTIVNRDLIVNAVWGDLASTQGVTDQAVDQLVFRLRKKIEENPNEPVHIQTVKGRGVKFSP